MIERQHCKEKLDDSDFCDSNNVEVKMLHFSLYQEQAVNRWEFPADQFVTYKFVYLFAKLSLSSTGYFFYLFMKRTRTKKIVQAIGQVQFVVFKKISSAYLN